MPKPIPDNADWQRDLSVSHNSIGDVQKAQDDLSAALESYRAAITIIERLGTAIQPMLIGRETCRCRMRGIGDVEEVNENIEAAIVSYKNSLLIAQGLADRFPEHPQFQSDIVITKRRLGQLRSKLTN